MKTLIQKRLLVKKEFELLEDGIKFSYKNPLHCFSREIPYEEVGLTTIVQKNISWHLVLVSAFLLIVFVTKVYFVIVEDKTDYGMTFLVLIFLAVAVLFTRLSYRNAILIEAGLPNYIEFYATSPDKETVNNFIESFITQTRKYLLYKYAKRNELLPLEAQVLQVNWLKNRNVITQQEYDKLLSMYKLPEQAAIGFRSNKHAQ